MVDNCRSRVFNLLLYPENEAHVLAMQEIRAGYSYAAILHNRDQWEEDDPKVLDGTHVPGEVKKEHWHVILKFKNAVWAASLEKQLGIPLQFMEKTSDFGRSARYLTHADNSEKAEYDISEVEGNLLPAVKKAMADDDENIRVLTLLDEIEKQGNLTVTAAIRMACKAGLYGELRRMGGLATFVIAEHNKIVDEREIPKVPDTYGFAERMRFTSETAQVLPFEDEREYNQQMMKDWGKR